MHDFIGVFDTLWQIVLLIGLLAAQLLSVLLQGALLFFWFAWALCAVNWPKAWEVLRHGAWAPFSLLVVFIALVWSQLLPEQVDFGFMTVPNFWWQLGAMGIIAGLTLACGWLQKVLRLTPETINLEPVAEAHHGHDQHGHGHNGH